MATATTTDEVSQSPPLESGDHLTATEFERRYWLMPSRRKAELIKGVVYVASPISYLQHSAPQGLLVTCLTVYSASTPGTDAGAPATLWLDEENMPEPDGVLRILPDSGGRCRVVGKYLRGMPELVVEVAASSASRDLHEKRDVYFEHGVEEYVVWRVYDRAIDVFVRRGQRIESLEPQEGILKSQFFPGLWFDTQALIGGDAARALSTLSQGLASSAHSAFVEQLARRQTIGPPE